MIVDYPSIKADGDATGLTDKEQIYQALLLLTDDVPRTRYMLNERTITAALILDTATPYTDAQAFMTGIASAGAAGAIPNYLVDDLAGEGLDVCDPLISAALSSLADTYGITQGMVDKLLALRTEYGVKRYPGLRRGYVITAYEKSEPGYGG